MRRQGAKKPLPRTRTNRRKVNLRVNIPSSPSDEVIETRPVFVETSRTRQSQTPPPSTGATTRNSLQAPADYFQKAQVLRRMMLQSYTKFQRYDPHAQDEIRRHALLLRRPVTKTDGVMCGSLKEPPYKSLRQLYILLVVAYEDMHRVRTQEKTYDEQCFEATQMRYRVETLQRAIRSREDQAEELFHPCFPDHVGPIEKDALLTRMMSALECTPSQAHAMVRDALATSLQNVHIVRENHAKDIVLAIQNCMDDVARSYGQFVDNLSVDVFTCQEILQIMFSVTK